MWSWRQALKISRAAAFCTDWSLSMNCFGRPASVAELSQAWKTSAPRWATASRRLTQIGVCFVVNCRRAAKHFEQVWVTWVRIVRSASIKIPRSRTHLTGDTRSEPTANGPEGTCSWLCRRAEAHHSTSVLDALSWSRLWNASNQRRQRHSQQHVSVDCRWRRGKSSNDAVRSGDQQYQMRQTGRAVLASTGRRDQRCMTGNVCCGRRRPYCRAYTSLHW